MQEWFPALAALLGTLLGVPLTLTAERMLRMRRRFSWAVHLAASVATGALFALVVWKLPVPELAPYLYLAVISVVLAIVDLAEKRLPNALIYPSLVALPLLLAQSAWATGEWSALLGALLGALALFAFYLVLALISPRGIGMGDVKLAAVIGLAMGYLGWNPVLVGAFGGFLVGAVVSLIALAAGRATRKSSLPFGPSMLAGAFLGILMLA